MPRETYFYLATLHSTDSRRKGALLKKSSLLLLDQFSSHLKNSVKEKLRQGNTELAVIPGGLTSQLQPLDGKNGIFLKKLLKN
jgi:hypothetical protein